jgi:nucleoid DNA-binding protein
MAKDETLDLDDFSTRIAKKTKMSSAVCRQFAAALFDTIGDDLAQTDKVAIPRFGGFKKKWMPASKGINPQTKEKIKIPAHYKVTFSPASALSDSVNRKYRNLKPNVLTEMLVLTGIQKRSSDETKAIEKNKDLQKEHGVARKRAFISLIVAGIVTLALLAVLVLVPVYFVNENNKVVNFVKSVNQMLGLDGLSDALMGKKKEQLSEEKVKAFISETRKSLVEGRNVIETYTVKPGDSIFSIANAFWNNPYLWPDLFLLNESKYTDPDLIFPGDQLVIYEKLGDPDHFSKDQRDRIVQAYVGVYRIYRSLGEADILKGTETGNKALSEYGAKRKADSLWTLFTAVHYDKNLLSKYKDAIYPEDRDQIKEYIKLYGDKSK